MLIQAVGLTGTLLFFLSYQCKSNRRLFQIQLLSYLCYTVHLLLLGAVTGGVSYIVNALRSICLSSRSPRLKSRSMCAILCLMQLAALLFTWAGPLSLLPIAANIAATIGGYTRNGRTIRLVGMAVNSPLWIAYNVLVGSWAGVLDEAVTEISMFLSILRYGWRDLNAVQD